MRNCDTITCAITPGAGCVVPSTASVFQAVGKTGFAADCCERKAKNGCCADSCGTTFGRNRNTDCGCNKDCECDSNCGTTFGRNRNTNCGCNNGCACDNDRSSSHHGNTPGMVYEADHQLCKMHEIEEAIRKGTLFSQLYMPMNGECADACGAQLCEGQAEAFAAWELRLYLNTHPCDQQALQLFQKMAHKTCEPNYATTFVEGCQSRWNWIDAPWPWEFNCSCE